MKSFKSFLLISIALVSINATTSVGYIYNISKDYTVTIKGTSNLHDWTETVGTVSGNGTVNWNSDKSFNLDAMSISMTVRSIKSTEGSVMNNNTYKALKADADPEITLKLNNPVKPIHPISNGTSILANVNLTIAGVTRTINMPVNIYMQEQQKLIVEGSQTINMTDYGIKLPTALFGALKTGNAITISFKTSFTTATN